MPQNSELVACPLPREEWDFSDERVPDSELIDCCLYEYAREAERGLWIAGRKDIERTRGQKPNPWNNDEYGERLVGNFQHLAVPQLKNQTADKPCYIPPAWQSLKKDRRKSLESKTGLGPMMQVTVGKRSPIPVPLASVLKEHLAELVKRNPKSHVVDEFGMRGDDCATFAMMVQLKDFSDKEIVDEFAFWLKQARKAHKIPDPGKKGKKMDAWRSRLNNLGIMRLRNRMYPKALYYFLRNKPLGSWNKRQPYFPELISVFSDSHRARAREFFQKLFPELGRPARPQHWVPLPPLRRKRKP